MEFPGVVVMRAMNFGMTFVALAAMIAFLGVAYAPAMAQSEGDDDWADAALALIAGINFESYAIGPLGSPWTVTASGASTMTVENLVALAGSGKALKINGGNTDTTDYVVGRYQFPDTSADIWVDFEVYTVGSGNEWGFRAWQNYSGSPFYELWISMDGGFLKTADWTVPEWDNCAAFSANAWHRVTVNLDFDTGLYDVYLDNTLVCNDYYQYWGDQTPYGYIDFLDWSDADFGGVTWIDNIYIGTTPPPVTTTTTTTTTTSTAGTTTTSTAGTTTTTTAGTTTTTTAGTTTTVTTTSTTTTTSGGDDDTDDDTTDDDTVDDDADDDADDDDNWPGGDDDTSDTGGSGGDDDDDGGCCGC